MPQSTLERGQMRVSRETMDLLQEMKKETGVPVRDILEEAVDMLWKRFVLMTGNRQYDALRHNPELQQEREQERARRQAIERDRLSRREAQTADEDAANIG